MADADNFKRGIWLSSGQSQILQTGEVYDIPYHDQTTVHFVYQWVRGKMASVFSRFFTMRRSTEPPSIATRGPHMWSGECQETARKRLCTKLSRFIVKPRTNNKALRGAVLDGWTKTNPGTEMEGRDPE